MVFNKLFAFSRLINLFQLSNARVLFVSLGGNENVQEGVVVALDEDGILGGVQLSNEGLVSVDNSDIQVRHSFGNGSCVQLLNLVLLVVLGDVGNGGGYRVLIINIDEALVSQY